LGSSAAAPGKVKLGLVASAALGSTLLCGSAFASDADPWFGPDKALHFGLSVLLSAGGYAASSVWLDTRAERAIAGASFSLTLGAGKELWDLSGHGDPSWRDFTWDVIGTGVGVAFALAGDALLSSKQSAGAHMSAQGLVLRF
jgi:putative lipoprotein